MDSSLWFWAKNRIELAPEEAGLVADDAWKQENLQLPWSVVMH